MGRLLVAVTFLFTCGCATTRPWHAEEADEPVELVARRVMEEQIFKGAEEIPICFDARDLRVSPNVFFHLSDRDRRVTTCRGEFKHPVAVHIWSYSRSARGIVVIHAGYWCGPLCSDDTEFIVQKTQNGWAIVSEAFHSIS